VRDIVKGTCSSGIVAEKLAKCALKTQDVKTMMPLLNRNISLVARLLRVRDTAERTALYESVASDLAVCAD
jgi:hypothetical protein